MRHVINPDTHLRLGRGPFQTRRIRPGLGIQAGDGGFGALGLVDRAHLSAGLVVPMHEHRTESGARPKNAKAWTWPSTQASAVAAG